MPTPYKVIAGPPVVAPPTAPEGSGPIPASGSADRARDLWTEAVEKEVKLRMDRYFNEEWMVLRVPRSCVPKGAELVECYQTEKEFVIMGQPASDDEEHNCDAMGCGTLTHVLVRIPRRNNQALPEGGAQPH